MWRSSRFYIPIAKCGFKIKGEPFTFSQIIARQDTYLRSWHVIGPFKFDPKKTITEQSYDPELKPFDLNARYIGLDGKEVSWKPTECNSNNIVDLRKHFDFEDKIAYAAAQIHSDKASEVTFSINSDDGNEVWLNGEKIHSLNVGRPIEHEPNIAKGKLKAGNNTLLLKISQYCCGWEFKVKVIKD